MDHSLFKASALASVLPSVKNIHQFTPLALNSPLCPTFAHRTAFSSTVVSNRAALSVKAGAGASHRIFGSLYAPLEVTSDHGKFLSTVLQNRREFFHPAAADVLKQLADDRDAVVNRVFLCAGSDEECLHRRIAQLKENDCQTAVEDVMYVLIFNKFSEIGAHLVPRLSWCIYNGRLEILPPSVWELESIHSNEVLEMVREHVSTMIGLRANCSVIESWATTKVRRLQLSQLYAGSILIGYFLKSASSRHLLERCLALDRLDYMNPRNSLQFPDILPCGYKSLVCSHASGTQSVSLSQQLGRKEKNVEELRCYVMGFDPETYKRCSKLKSKEAVNLINKHCSALFCDEQTGLLKEDEEIVTSFSSLKRLALEAVALGSFLWDIEEYVDTVYKLKEN